MRRKRRFLCQSCTPAYLVVVIFGIPSTGRKNNTSVSPSFVLGVWVGLVLGMCGLSVAYHLASFVLTTLESMGLVKGTRGH